MGLVMATPMAAAQVAQKDMPMAGAWASLTVGHWVESTDKTKAVDSVENSADSDATTAGLTAANSVDAKAENSAANLADLVVTMAVNWAASTD